MGMHMVVTMIDQKIDQPYAGKVHVVILRELLCSQGRSSIRKNRRTKV